MIKRIESSLNHCRDSGLQDILRTATEAALKAGDVLLARYEQPHQILFSTRRSLRYSIISAWLRDELNFVRRTSINLGKYQADCIYSLTAIVYYFSRGTADA